MSLFERRVPAGSFVPDSNHKIVVVDPLGNISKQTGRKVQREENYCCNSYHRESDQCREEDEEAQLLPDSDAHFKRRFADGCFAFAEPAESKL